jgi:hypothetical protein
VGNPRKSTIDKAMRDLGLPDTLLKLRSTRPLLLPHERAGRGVAAMQALCQWCLLSY